MNEYDFTITRYYPKSEKVRILAEDISSAHTQAEAIADNTQDDECVDTDIWGVNVNDHMDCTN